MHVYIDKITNEHVDKEITIKGWLYNKRSSGKIHFLELRDGTGLIQAIAGITDVGEEIFEEIKKITQESSVIVTGKVSKHPKKENFYELVATKVELVSLAQEYPISKKEHGPDFLLDNRHLWLRSKRQMAIMRIRHTIVKACRDFFDNRGYTLFDSPILTGNACEGTTTLFETDYFGQPAYLSQSGQLYGEAGAFALGKIYVFGPTFRAEKSKTRRHLTEFWMIEPEVAYLELEGIMELAEDFLSYLVERVLDKNKVELEIIERDFKKLEGIAPPFPRISYTEAVEILRKEGINFEWGGDFGAPDETIISGKFDKPVMVHRFPTEIKAFYMKRDPKNEKVVLGVDVLAPEGYGEIIGGAQREDNLDFLLERIEEHKLPREIFEWYLDLRKYGSVPHGGFGMGLERAVTWICGLQHLRETIPFPRMLQRLYP
ncbi:asparagine--tRNA ligase [bacterium]|nr:asparagine--tRNA ligase [bacterium]